MLPLSLLNTAKGHPMLVELKNGDTYNGRLDGDKFVKMDECYVHGNNIKYLRLPEEIISLVPEETVRTKGTEGRGFSGRGSGRGGGRFTGGRGAGGRDSENNPGGRGHGRGGGEGRGGSGGRGRGGDSGGRFGGRFDASSGRGNSASRGGGPGRGRGFEGRGSH